MRTKQWTNLFARAALFGCICGVAAAERDPNGREAAASVATPAEPAAALSAEGFERPYQRQLVDPCAQAEVVSTPQPAELECSCATAMRNSGNGFIGFVSDSEEAHGSEMFSRSVRYGLTPRVNCAGTSKPHLPKIAGTARGLSVLETNFSPRRFASTSKDCRCSALAFSYGTQDSDGQSRQGVWLPDFG